MCPTRSMAFSFMKAQVLLIAELLPEATLRKNRSMHVPKYDQYTINNIHTVCYPSTVPCISEHIFRVRGLLK